MRPSERLIRARELAASLGVPEGTVRTWLAQGRLLIPVVRLGRAIRFREADLTRLLEEKKALVEPIAK